MSVWVRLHRSQTLTTVRAASWGPGAELRSSVEKLMYLVWLPEGTSRQDVETIMLGETAEHLLALSPHGLTMDLDDTAADVTPPVPPPEGEHMVQAVVSIWVNACDERPAYEAVLQQVATKIAGYQVVESMYRDYGQSRWAAPRSWPDGERSPSVLTVAMFEQKRDLEFNDWIERWHTRISPMSEAIQPRCRYVRNAVFRGLTPGAPPYRGIVEEAWPDAEHITDPMLFYVAEGDPVRMQENMTTMINEIVAFIDLDTMRSVTMSEWILKS